MTLFDVLPLVAEHLDAYDVFQVCESMYWKCWWSPDYVVGLAASMNLKRRYSMRQLAEMMEGRCMACACRTRARVIHRRILKNLCSGCSERRLISRKNILECTRGNATSIGRGRKRGRRLWKGVPEAKRAQGSLAYLYWKEDVFPP